MEWRRVRKKTRNLKLESGEKTAGLEFSLFRDYNLQRLQKQAGGVNRRGGDKAAAKDGYRERSDKEN